MLKFLSRITQTVIHLHKMHNTVKKGQWKFSVSASLDLFCDVEREVAVVVAAAAKEQQQSTVNDVTA